jgi:GcrA cell cycle regulator
VGQEGEAVMSGPKWDDDHIERLRTDWVAGLSIATIAQRMGTTKSAITGKAKRLGLKKPIPALAFQRDQDNKTTKTDEIDPSVNQL